MKTAFQKTLLLGFLLILVVATGCSQQVEQSAANPSKTVTTENPDEQKLEDDQPKSTGDDSDKSATGDSEGDPNTTAQSPAEIKKADDASAKPTIDIPATWKRLSKDQEIWIDSQKKRVIVGGKVCLTGGPLEMLICPPNTKEHEAIVSVNAESWQVHAALLAVGAKQGVPCRWVPEYTPAWGSKIDVQMMWRDEKTNQVKTVDGKQWILNSDTQKPMTKDLVFGGSYSEPQVDGEKARYLADGGELICLANFSTSTIDLHVGEEEIDTFFEANTPLIPPVNTQVFTVIIPGPVVGKPEE